MSGLEHSSPAAVVTGAGDGARTPSSTTAYSGEAAALMSASSGATLENGAGHKGEPTADPTMFAVDLAQYIFNSGFCLQQWADIQIVFFTASLKLHRLILARSPYLAHVMSSSMPGSTLHLQIPDLNVTEESIYVVLQHLYQPSLHLVTPLNARSIIATSFIFGGMPELTHHAYTLCRDSISSSNVIDYVHWLAAPSISSPPLQHQGLFHPLQQQRSPLNGYGSPPQPTASPIGFGSIGSVDPVTPAAPSAEAWSDEGAARYGEWSSRLKDDVVTFLLRTLPSQITDASSGSSLHTDTTLLAIYTQLPFELFKRCTESPDLPIEFMQDRFAFAKKAIAQRKKRAAAAGGGVGGVLGGMEESVVLALSNKGDGMDVHITRKPKRSRSALWKVEG